MSGLRIQTSDGARKNANDSELGTMTTRRFLIVNADDLGQSFGINRGVIRAHRQGIVTSASLMVRWPVAAEVTMLSQKFPDLSIGLHLDFGEWLYRDGDWEPRYQVVAFDDPLGLKAEVVRQLDAFRRLLGRNPTHIDSHQHVHLDEPLRSIVAECACELAVPVRRFHPEIRYCGDFYGQDSDGSYLHELITIESLLKILAGLPPGVTELSCHPSESEDLDTMYCAERCEELKVLCDPRVREAITSLGIKLCSFQEAQVKNSRCRID
jgi:predicted glycoside hydrolase/deacetylase ChbG (UPF0249 family)